MDKIQKALRKLKRKELGWFRQILRTLDSGDWPDLDVQKLSGHKDVYRAKKGKLRVIFRQSNDRIFILAVERRSDNTYRKY
jgi:mRNA-degrading endonuclease RelE of RelBE toxin-antitoxin system